MRLGRLLGAFLLGLIASAAIAPTAQADSGTITNVRDVGGGQLEATFSASGTECTSYSYCGWYATASEVAHTASCSVSGGHLVWVGDFHSETGSETKTARFYRSHTPSKLCLVVNGANGDSVVAEATWSPPPPPPPGLVSPENGRALSRRSSVTFTAVAQDAAGLAIEISRSAALDPDGTLANEAVVEQGTALSSPYPVDQFEYDSRASWSMDPGTYYWQVHRTGCPVPGCDPNSEVRVLTILPPVLNLSARAASRQQLRAPVRGDRYNNLVTRLRCNLRCTVYMSARAYYRRGGTRRVLPGSRFTDTFRLPAARTQYFGFHFPRGARSRLAKAIARYGSLLWEFEYDAESGSAEPDFATLYIRMLAPPAPRRPRAPAAPQNPQVDCQGYSPCIAPGSDVDCSGGSGNGPRYVDGPVRVYGSDPYGLDSDGDGWGCE